MKNYYVDSISDGIAIGNALVINFNSKNPKIQRSIGEEKSKLNLALELSFSELEELEENNKEAFIGAHKLLIQDKTLKDEIYYQIEYNNLSAYDACETVFDKYINIFKESDSNYLKERYLDFLDIKQRLIRNLCNETLINTTSQDIVLVVEELIPSLLVDFKEKIKGVICKKGGFTSHGAILCRAMGIPCVIANDVLVKSNEKVIIDTRRNILFVNPTKEEIKHYTDIISLVLMDDYNLLKHDGYKVLCNVSSNEELAKASKYDIDGVGLYRTEFIFMNSKQPLQMEEQYEIYSEAINIMGERPICFRTFDIGSDKQIEFVNADKKGIDNYINNPQIFEDQITALLKSNSFNNIKIMFPMIKSKSEFLFLKNWVLDIKSKLGNTSIIEIGMMLETKQALENISDFIDADFISIGTNDLTTELYNISRNSNISYLSYLDDLIIKLKDVVLFATANNKCLSICGELASITTAAEKFLELGITNYSVSTPNIKTLNLAISKFKKGE